MGLVTLILLITFTALYLSKSIQTKPALMTELVDKVSGHVEKLSLYGAAYALVAAFLTMIMAYGSGDMLIRLFANVLIILMALPSVFNQLTPQFQDKVNPVFIDEGRNLVGWVTKQDKYIGYVGAVISLLLFAVLFR